MDLIPLFIIFLTFSNIYVNSVIAVNPSGFSLKIIHRDSKESPLYPGDHLTPEERLQRLVQQSKDRARYIGLQTSFNKTTNWIDPISVSYEGVASFYVAEIRIGTFPWSTPTYKRNYLIVDTGSETVWIQCAGALRYFHQDEPLYPAGSSTTYEPLRCRDNHPFCDEQRRCENGECRYLAQYTNTESSGALAKESFWVNLESDPPQSFDIIMGCGFYQYGFDRYLGTGSQRGIPDLVTGVLGLSSRPKSLVSQLEISTFSHCLKPYRSDNPQDPPTSTYLRFGSDATIGNGASVTPLFYPPPDINNERRGPYRLNLLDIIVNGIPVDRVRGSNFGPATGGGFSIDSGTPFTVMQLQTFNKVKNAVYQYFNGEAGIRPIPKKRDQGSFELCYRKPVWRFDYPTMTLQFQHADYLINESELFFDINDVEFCLGIVPGATNILGAMQQAGKRILFNTEELNLYFIAEDC